MPKLYSFLLTLLVSTTAIAQGTETFTNIPASNSSYTTRNWTGDNGLTWTATDARTDQTLNGRAIAIRNGSVFCYDMTNGIGNLSFTHQQIFSGSNSVLQIYINNTLVGCLL